MNEFVATHKTGRCATGTERDRGHVLHALQGSGLFDVADIALCGATYGRRSAGWSATLLPADRVTCPKCLDKLKAFSHHDG